MNVAAVVPPVGCASSASKMETGKSTQRGYKEEVVLILPLRPACLVLILSLRPLCLHAGGVSLRLNLRSPAKAGRKLMRSPAEAGRKVRQCQRMRT